MRDLLKVVSPFPKISKMLSMPFNGYVFSIIRVEDDRQDSIKTLVFSVVNLVYKCTL